MADLGDITYMAWLLMQDREYLGLMETGYDWAWAFGELVRNGSVSREEMLKFLGLDEEKAND